MKKISCKIVVLFAATLMLLTSAPICYATSNAQFSMKVYKYDSQGGNYTEATVFNAGDSVLLAVSVTGIENTAVYGNALKITYDNTLFYHQDKNAVFCGSDKNTLFFASSKNGTVNVSWDTTSRNTFFSGEVYYLRFKVADTVAANTASTFQMTVTDLFAALNGFPDIPFSVSTPNLTVNVISQTIDSSVIAILNNLETVTVDSLDDITAGYEAYNLLSNLQKKVLLSEYPNQYNWLSTAKERYYAAVNAASKKQISDAVTAFKTQYADILSREVSSITIADSTAINNLQTAYDALPTTIQSRLGKTVVDKVSALSEQLEALENTVYAAQYFCQRYSGQYGMTDIEITAMYSVSYPSIDEGIMVYETYDEATKALLSNEYTLLQNVQNKTNELIASNEEERAIREEVNAFQKKWIHCFTLNTSAVTVGDKNELENAMADYNSLNENVQIRLKTSLDTIQKLMKVVEYLEMDEKSDTAIAANAGIFNEDGIEPISEAANVSANENVTTTAVRHSMSKSTYHTISLVFVFVLISAFLVLRFYRKRLIKSAAKIESDILTESDNFS